MRLFICNVCILVLTPVEHHIADDTTMLATMGDQGGESMTPTNNGLAQSCMSRAVLATMCPFLNKVFHLIRERKINICFKLYTQKVLS